MIASHIEKRTEDMEMNGNSREAVFQEIISLADAIADRLTARRRDFHKYAETGW